MEMGIQGVIYEYFTKDCQRSYNLSAFIYHFALNIDKRSNYGKRKMDISKK